MLLKNYRMALKYCSEYRQWLVWTGNKWEIDSGELIDQLVVDTVRSVIKEIQSAVNGKEQFDLIRQWSQYLNQGKKNAVKEAARSIPTVRINSNHLDSDPWLLNCLNGTIDLKTGSFKEHSPNDLITKCCPVNFDPNAESEVWELFLKQTMPDAALREFVQKAVGYSLTADIREEKLFFIYGPGGTGKSTFLSALQSILGDYAVSINFETLMPRTNNGSARSDLIRLQGKRFVTSIEASYGQRFAEGLVKSMTGGDTIVARRLFCDEVEFTPTHKLWLAANERPKVRDDDTGLWRRILQIPFYQTPAKVDPLIKTTLRDPSISGSAILTWAVQGCLKYLSEGLGIPKAINDATNEYRNQMDPLYDFIQDSCQINSTAKVYNNTLWSRYLSWCQDNSEKPLGRKQFALRLQDKSIKQGRDNKGRYWLGITLMDID
jgi:putative DNA primase/helicase